MGWFRKREPMPQPELPEWPAVGKAEKPTSYRYNMGLTPVGVQWEWTVTKIPVYDGIREGKGAPLGKGIEHKKFQAEAAAHAVIYRDREENEVRGRTQWTTFK
jgi:hypothetical protein